MSGNKYNPRRGLPIMPCDIDISAAEMSGPCPYCGTTDGTCKGTGLSEEEAHSLALKFPNPEGKIPPYTD